MNPPSHYISISPYREADTAAEWTRVNRVVAPGVEGYETDTGKTKVGNGRTPWRQLPYTGGTAPPPASGLPPGGVKGQTLIKNSSTDGDASWKNFPASPPVSGTVTYAFMAKFGGF